MEQAPPWRNRRSDSPLIRIAIKCILRVCTRPSPNLAPNFGLEVGRFLAILICRVEYLLAMEESKV
jgi:hypothetical protein